MAAAFKTILVLLAVILISVILAPFQFVLMKTWPSASRKIPIIWHKTVLRLIGVRVFIHGEMATNRPLMIVSNHVSWSDIVVLGSVGELCFIAKDEVKTWPGISWLSKLQRTVFVNRERKRDASYQADTIASRLASGDAMVLFAEGTTGNGNKLLPFKTALFAAPMLALEQTGIEQMTVQPVALAYNSLHGMPLGRYHQTLASWPGDIALLPHLKNFVLQGAFDVDVSFGECIEITAQTHRKDLAARTYNEVKDHFARMRRQNHKS